MGPSSSQFTTLILRVHDAILDRVARYRADSAIPVPVVDDLDAACALIRATMKLVENHEATIATLATRRAEAASKTGMWS